MRFFLILLFLLQLLTLLPHWEKITFFADSTEPGNSSEKVHPEKHIQENIANNTRIENDFAYPHIKTYPPLYYEIQIAVLNLNTELELFYNKEVQEYIDLFLHERPEKFREMIKLSALYFPVFERQLQEYNLPPELKYLPALESGFSPYACSPSQAKGLWQFKKETGLHYGLVIDDIYDEREDPEESTTAACRYLSDLYGYFGSWDLALLAYNAGPATVRNAIRRAGSKTGYHEIYPYLTEPAQKYLPALVAIVYLLNNYAEHFPVNEHS